MLFFKSGCDPPATAGGSVYRGGKGCSPEIAAFFVAVAKHLPGRGVKRTRSCRIFSINRGKYSTSLGGKGI